MCMPQRQPSLKSTEPDRRWFVILVQPGYELSVQANLVKAQGVSMFVPYRTEVRQWADRKVVTRKALLPRYLMAFVDLQMRGQLVTIRRVLKFLRFGGELAWLRDDEIESLRCISERAVVEPEAWTDVMPGRLVRILSGPLAGCVGQLVERHLDQYFTVQLPMLGRQIAAKADLSRTDISLLPKPGVELEGSGAKPAR